MGENRERHRLKGQRKPPDQAGRENVSYALSKGLTTCNLRTPCLGSDRPLQSHVLSGTINNPGVHQQMNT